jgi:galactonate dehydratase
MKIVKLEDFHADGGWDTYSFLKITTDEGITELDDNDKP